MILEHNNLFSTFLKVIRIKDYYKKKERALPEKIINLKLGFLLVTLTKDKVNLSLSSILNPFISAGVDILGVTKTYGFKLISSIATLGSTTAAG